jgi:large subunit ribosomal protein L21
MYAIVRTGGKQYRVERGQRLLIERLPAKEGAEVSLEPLLYRSEEAVLDRAGLEQVKVTAKVVEHVRGEKLRVFKFKPKRGYRRRTGHRQNLTRIEVTEISAHKRRASQAAAGERPAKAPAAKAKAPAAGKAPAKPARARKPASETGAAKAAAKPARGAKRSGEGERGKAPAKPARASRPAKTDSDGS